MVGKTVFDFLPSDIAAKFYAEDLQVLQSGEPLVRCVDPSVDSAGNRVWMSVTKMPLRDEDGRLLGLVSATHDITARKDAEEQLARYAEKLREKNAQLEEDLETARELQNALLPQQYPRFPSSSAPENSALRFHHFFRSCSGRGRRLLPRFVRYLTQCAGVFISDVMGRGVQSRACCGDCCARSWREFPARPPRNRRDFFRELNRGISEILKHAHLPIFFVSACYLVVDVARRTTAICGCGPSTRHSGFVRTRRSVEPLPRPVLKVSILCLGSLPMQSIEGLSCELCAGDTVLLFTDGLFEVRRGRFRDFFDQSGLL